MEQMITKVILCGIFCKEGYFEYQTDDDTLKELESLVETAGGTVVAQLVQNRIAPDSKTFIGEGKIEELKELIAEHDANLIVFDNELSPLKIKILERETDIRVIDRSMLILDIFALHATSAEGKLQVELAQLRYTLPRLTGKGLELSRQGAGIGTRGPGETKLETDRRNIKNKIAILKAQLKEIRNTRQEQRKSRDRSNLKKLAIIGYTNAGKSTLLNTLTGAGVLVEDKLFATLDPTTRKLEFEDGREILLTDTVGFIRNLPHHLVDAFSSTLEEVTLADIILNVVDVSDESYQKHIKVTEELLIHLKAADKPVITVYNKADKCNTSLIPFDNNTVAISAKSGENINKLLEQVQNVAFNAHITKELLIPYDKNSAVDFLHRNVSVVNEEYIGDGVKLTVTGDAAFINKYKEFFL